MPRSIPPKRDPISCKRIEKLFKILSKMHQTVVRTTPARPLVAIVGGAKINDKYGPYLLIEQIWRQDSRVGRTWAKQNASRKNIGNVCLSCAIFRAMLKSTSNALGLSSSRI